MKNKTPFEITAFTGFMLLLLIIYIFVSGNDSIKLNQIAENESRMELEDAITKSYNEENIIEINALKENIEGNIKNSKVTNPETNNFPLYAVVGDYEFKIDETQTDFTKDEEKDVAKDEDKSDIKNEVIDNTIIDEPEDKNDTEEPDIKPEVIEYLVKYSNDVKEEMGIRLTTTDDGIVTINGKATTNMYIKISNNIKFTKDSKDFIKWAEEDGIIINKGVQVKPKLTVIDLGEAKGEVNFVLRSESNIAKGIIKILNDETEKSFMLDENIIANYVYIAKNSEFNNMSFKVEVTKERIDEKLNQNEGTGSNLIQLINTTEIAKGVEIITNEDGTVTLNGTSKDRMYIEIQNGINISFEGGENSQNAIKNQIVAVKNKNIEISIKEISGEYTTNDVNQQINLVLKDTNGNIVSKSKLKDKMFYERFVPQNDISMVYIYVSGGISFSDYKIEPKIFQ